MKKYVVFYFVFLVAACQTETTDNRTEEVKIRKNITESVKVKDVFSDLKFINLEVNDSCLMRNSRKITLADNTLFISDGSSIFQYSTDGRHIRTLNRKGRGPQEYYDVLDFIVHDNTVYIIDRNRKILKFTTDNKYLASNTLDFFPATLYQLNHKELLLTSAYQNEVDKFHVFDSESLQEISSFHTIEKAELSYRHIMNQTNFFEFDKKLLFHEPMNNYLSRIDNNSASFLYHFDFYGMNPPSDFWTQTYSNVMDINMKATREKYCFGIPVYAENRDNILLSYRDADKYLLCLYSKRNGDAIQFESIEFFETMPPVRIEDLSLNFFSEKNMTIAIPGHLFFDEEGQIYVPELSSVVKDGGNPVICQVKLK